MTSDTELLQNALMDAIEEIEKAWMEGFVAGCQIDNTRYHKSTAAQKEQILRAQVDFPLDLVDEEDTHVHNAG